MTPALKHIAWLLVKVNESYSAVFRRKSSNLAIDLFLLVI